MCVALIFRNGHEVSSRVGDMSRTFNHLFVVINMPTQISHIHVYEQGKRYQTRKQVRGGGKRTRCQRVDQSL